MIGNNKNKVEDCVNNVNPKTEEEYDGTFDISAREIENLLYMTKKFLMATNTLRIN